MHTHTHTCRPDNAPSAPSVPSVPPLESFFTPSGPTLRTLRIPEPPGRRDPSVPSKPSAPLGALDTLCTCPLLPWDPPSAPHAAPQREHRQRGGRWQLAGQAVLARRAATAPRRGGATCVHSPLGCGRRLPLCPRLARDVRSGGRRADRCVRAAEAVQVRPIKVAREDVSCEVCVHIKCQKGAAVAVSLNALFATHCAPSASLLAAHTLYIPRY